LVLGSCGHLASRVSQYQDDGPFGPRLVDDDLRRFLAHYESRLARIELPEDEKPKIDAEIEELTEDEATTEQERIKRKWATVEALVGRKSGLR
jgi:hypothetical protein